MSVLLRPTSLAVDRLHLATAAVAMSGADAVALIAEFTPDLKWPNDLLVGDRKLAGVLTEDVLIRDWTQQNKSWFSAVQLEKRMMFIILALIIAVAAFNLVSSLVMSVRDKESDIAILRTLGASPKSVLAIFVVQGALIGLAGCFIGVVLGVLIALNVGSIVGAIERVFHIAFLPQNIYFVSALPSDLRLSDVIAIGCVSVFLSFVATLYPSWRAARVEPAQALRYE